jgi:hypothetical protein
VAVGSRNTGTLVAGPTTVASAQACFQRCADNFDCGFWNYYPATNVCDEVGKKTFFFKIFIKKN